MKPRSAKAKGKRLQNWVRDLLLSLNPELQKDDVRSTTMGDGGEDVQLSPAARKVVPFQIECKNKRSMAIYTMYRQAASHGAHEPLLVVKENEEAPLVVMDAAKFFALITRIKTNGSA